jgi:hypothetical protein
MTVRVTKKNRAESSATAVERRPAGRPSVYTDDLAADICIRIGDGQSVREIGRAGDMPDARTIFRWLAGNDIFRQQYVLACEARALRMADEINDIADDGSNDWMERFNAEGQSIGWTLNGEHVQRSKLRVDTRRWLLSKLMPKKYGDRLDVNTTLEVTLRAEPDEAIDKRLAEIERQLGVATTGPLIEGKAEAIAGPAGLAKGGRQ